MALDSLTSTLSLGLKWQAQKAITGTDYAPNQNATSLKKDFAVGTTAGNAVVGGGDVLSSFITSVAGGGTATIDLTSLTEITGATGISLARVKGVLIRLLSVADDATNGTAATSVTIGNNAANDWISQSGSGWLGTATSVFVLPNGGAVGFGTPSAGGVLVDATHKILKITNDDGAVAAKVQTSFQGGSS